MQVQTGACDIVLAGGAESMSQVEFYSPTVRWGPGGEQIQFHDRLARARVTAGGADHPVPGGMLETAENLRREYSISREEQDELALRSHQRAVAAQQAGAVRRRDRPDRRGGPEGHRTSVTRDEHPRADTTLESLGRLRPMLGRSDSASTVTAGNASGQNDGASICLVTTRAIADDLGVAAPGPSRQLGRRRRASEDHGYRSGSGYPEGARAPRARARRTWTSSSSTRRSPRRSSRARGSGGSPRRTIDRLNVNGSGISLGHPVGATGGRILATLAHELLRRDARYGLETMCIGGGQGLAAVFEAVT